MAQDWTAYRQRMDALERRYDGRIPREELAAAEALRPVRQPQQKGAE